MVRMNREEWDAVAGPIMLDAIAVIRELQPGAGPRYP